MVILNNALAASQAVYNIYIYIYIIWSVLPAKLLKQPMNKLSVCLTYTIGLKIKIIDAVVYY